MLSNMQMLILAFCSVSHFLCVWCTIVRTLYYLTSPQKSINANVCIHTHTHTKHFNITYKMIAPSAPFTPWSKKKYVLFSGKPLSHYTVTRKTDSSCFGDNRPLPQTSLKRNHWYHTCINSEHSLPSWNKNMLCFIIFASCAGKTPILYTVH